MCCTHSGRYANALLRDAVTTLLETKWKLIGGGAARDETPEILSKPYPPEPTTEQIQCFTSAEQSYLQQVWWCIANNDDPVDITACINGANALFCARWEICEGLV